KVAESVVISEQEPCSKCNEELFLYEIKRPLTILSCRHTYHCDYIERSIKISLSCLRPDCKKEVESAVINSSRKQKDDNDSIDISPLLFNDSLLILFLDHSQKKCINESTDNISNKKAKKLVNRNDSSKLRKMIEKLSSETPQDQEVIEVSTGNFFILFDAIIKVEE
ncbi:219_t:CDS:1, partial [Funneliformis geosporum]